jgi:hypothetical protein
VPATLRYGFLCRRRTVRLRSSQDSVRGSSANFSSETIFVRACRFMCQFINIPIGTRYLGSCRGHFLSIPGSITRAEQPSAGIMRKATLIVVCLPMLHVVCAVVGAVLLMFIDTYINYDNACSVRWAVANGVLDPSILEAKSKGANMPDFSGLSMQHVQVQGEIISEKLVDCRSYWPPFVLGTCLALPFEVGIASICIVQVGRGGMAPKKRVDVRPKTDLGVSGALGDE